ncbi:MAG: chromate transporter [Bacilli bacterium]|nr:chromate transporter [Bacilli bacterium]
MAKKFLLLALSMLKIGLFTFGGGYAMIALFENEFVLRKGYLQEEEFSDIVAIAESTPGPIAINLATYIGYKVGKVGGSILATFCVCLPSFAIIYVISLFLNQFLSFTYVAAAFKGIKVSVIFLIFFAGIRMLRKLKRNAFNIIVFVVTFSLVLLFGLFMIDFSAIFYLLASAALGLGIYAIKWTVDKRKPKESELKEGASPDESKEETSKEEEP